MKFQVSPEANREGREAAAWYDDQRWGLGEQFLAKARITFEQIGANPFAFARWEHYDGPLEIRAAYLGRFPYVVVYVVKPEHVTVLAISHAHRHPLYWLSRLE